MCVSPATRTPTRTSATSEPTDSTIPVNSWPGMSGGLIRDSAQRSHSTMWRSVPQIAKAVTRILTSLGPTFGIGAVMRVRPGPGADFSIAHIVPWVTVGSFCVRTANVSSSLWRLWVRRGRNQGNSLVAPGPVDNVPERDPAAISPPILREVLRERPERADPGHVRRDPDSLGRSKGMRGRQRLLAEDVEERPRRASLRDSLQKRRLVDGGAPRGIHEGRAL